MDAGANSAGAMEFKIKELTAKLSKLEGLAGMEGGGGGGRGGDDRTLLQQHQEEMLGKLTEIRASLASETGDLESVKAANEEVAKLREVIKRKDYRILHLTRSLDAASGNGDA